ncbi:glycosyltransferase family 4 protein [Plectonema radiosum NIES-515]|uniref:Glycosyltransferase family 4 protein n=1 Tax=Plectonema radiosum NIES-515 TaxID=2986073 RepID=A0ABT3B0W9_9CYAN|nr:glycosyltransferase family 4 protein [Plectonema radiosum]MCV3214635.1 glycosyltransferase family 4 protein [Plectonema radiosum NIES-515]
MKVTVSVCGRFHAFNLAQQLQTKKYLHKLISTYPSFAITKFGIDKQFIHSIWHLEALSRSWYRLPVWLRGDRNLQLWFVEEFDRSVTNSLSSGFDLFVGWSGYNFWSLHRAKELGAKTIIERGSSHMHYQTEILKEEYERWGLKFTETHPGIYEREIKSYADADKITVPSLFAKRTFLEQGISESKLIHVPYGTSLAEFYPVPKEDDIFRVIHCGGINLRKGIQYLLQAFYELNLPKAELWLVGAIAPEIKPFLAKYQSDRIIYKGKQPQNQLRWFYSQCSVFCLASIEEGLAMVQPQAMACGLPIIHTTNTGGEDIVRDGIDGFCVPIRTVETLKEKILFFYENPDKREQMGRNALEQARQSLSWDEYGEKIVNNYLYLFN